MRVELVSVKVRAPSPVDNRIPSPSTDVIVIDEFEMERVPAETWKMASRVLLVNVEFVTVMIGARGGVGT